jgi:ornithine cyclodeaminase/alanine dehydrogenase-like protein (mu-crystallin family)
VVSADTVYSYEAVRECADLKGLTRELNDVLECGGHKDMVIPKREVIARESRGQYFLSMPALSDRHGIFINKTATAFRRPAGSDLPLVTALVTVFSGTTGRRLALLDGAAITNLKCAAVSAVVTDHCSPEDADVLAIIGAGVQARQQFLGVSSVRNLKQVRLHARNSTQRAAMADELRRLGNAALEVVECNSIDDAVETANIVGTTTASTKPLASFGRLLPSVHINCMGAHTVSSREIPHAVLAASLLVVEDVATAVAEAGPVHLAAIELAGLPGFDRGRLRGNRSIFSSTGHAFLDLVTTAHVMRQLGLAFS